MGMLYWGLNGSYVKAEQNPIVLTEENSYTCELHVNLKCRIYPRRMSVLEKHYADSDSVCEHLMAASVYCSTCRIKNNQAAARRKGTAKGAQAIRTKERKVGRRRDWAL